MQTGRLVWAGRWDEAGAGPVLTEPGDRREIARRARLDFDDEPLRRPFAFARHCGFEPIIAPVRGCGGELGTDRIIYIRWHIDHETLALRALHGVAHALFRREGWEHSEADAWLLTADLIRPNHL